MTGYTTVTSIASQICGGDKYRIKHMRAKDEGPLDANNEMDHGNLMTLYDVISHN